MRTITKKIAEAFKAGKPLDINNTSTDGRNVYLFGNHLARRSEQGAIEMTLAGWNTVTTRDRLNGLLRVLELDGYFSTRKGTPVFRDTEIDSRVWIAI